MNLVVGTKVGLLKRWTGGVINSTTGSVCVCLSSTELASDKSS